ncbi:unnamed protein product [Ambrosiozyma monospora]|uniref:Unnamed protein product n=1 Tax=Ambrosiozyma monospora TaxID=43982 RepID=A0ACB5UCV0_AMBMO|nr:unnamed protein product [Ambrosiozyma monospora]
MAVDLLEGLLQKDPVKRIDIPDIKTYDFFNEGLSRTESRKYIANWDSGMKIDVSAKDVDEAVLGIGNRIKKKLSDVFRFGSGSSSTTKYNSNSSVVPPPSNSINPISTGDSGLPGSLSRHASYKRHSLNNTNNGLRSRRGSLVQIKTW